MAKYVQFTKTEMVDVTAGKMYEVLDDPDLDGFTFKDDVGDERVIKRQSKRNKFQIIDLSPSEAAETNDSLSDDEDTCEAEPTDGGEPSYVVFVFNDGEEVVFHDLLRVDIIDGDNATAAKVEAQDGATHVVMMANVRYMTMMGMH